MARILQAFHSNPALGGFGNESGFSIKEGDCDAFAQIVKELVDNAVDACRQDSDRIRRVRVDFSQVSHTVLRVTVSDNGCGMSCIQDCVEAFRSNKRDPSNQAKTAGRYGIGLTLCLLHAQRLVPNSRASITSATKTSTTFQQADYVVDTEGDCVNCIPGEATPKTRSDESGTSVSVLIPGGPMAHRAWPRLAEYFARFQLSLGLPCSLEVMAPTLSSVPLFVRSPLESNALRVAGNPIHNIDNDEWNPDKVDADSDSACSTNDDSDTHKDIQRAVSCYLRCNIELKNVAHSIQYIRNGKRRTKNSPTLEVDLIVYEKDDNDDENEEANNNPEMPSAQMTLVRMVNRIPLLDGAEASACGLVQCLASKKSMWASFGLSANHGTDLTAQDLRLFVPTYNVRDSDSVASFFHNRNPHQLFEMHDNDVGNTDESGRSGDEEDSKPKSNMRSMPLLPAHLRLGKVLAIIQIHAQPSSLPLPTLSKSRLPLNDAAIDSAVEAGVMECLRSLQKTNPNLLLTPKQLKTTIRDTRYIPSTAAAMACVVCKSKDGAFQKHFLNMIRQWSNGEGDDLSSLSNGRVTKINDNQTDNDILEVTTLGPLLEAKLRDLCVVHDSAKVRAQKKPKITRMTTRNTATTANILPSLASPLNREASGSWGGMSPSPVKNMRKMKQPVPRRLRESLDSLETEMSSSPLKKSTQTSKRKLSKETPLDSPACDQALDSPQSLTVDDDSYIEDDDDW